MSQTKKYLPEYLKMGFIESVVNKLKPMRLLHHKTLSDEAMKQRRLREHLSKSIQMISASPLNIFRKYIKNFKIVQQSLHHFNMQRTKID